MTPRSLIVFILLALPAVAGCLSDGDTPPSSDPFLADFEDCDRRLPGGQQAFCKNRATSVDPDWQLPDDWYCIFRFELSQDRAWEIYQSPSGGEYAVWWRTEIETSVSGLTWRENDQERSEFNWSEGEATDAVRIPEPLRDDDDLGLMIYRATYETNTSRLQGGTLDQIWNYRDKIHVIHRLRTDQGTYYFPGADLRSYRLEGQDFGLSIRFPKYMDVGVGSAGWDPAPEPGCHRTALSTTAVSSPATSRATG